MLSVCEVIGAIGVRRATCVRQRLLCFFFQAEDGIRDLTVTGVQTCALPICVWPAVRKATIEYRAPAFARDVLRIETTVVGRGTTSMTLRHVVRRISDDAAIAEAEMVFVCIDRLGRATPIPDEIARFLGPRPSGGHQPIQVPAGGVELAVGLRGEGGAGLFVAGFPVRRAVWRRPIAHPLPA